jgi:anthranilate phosphoribosyltransferase
MKKILNQLFEHKKLDKEQAKEVLINISQNKYNVSQISAFITVYLMRSITAEELEGFKDALIEMCIPVKLETDHFIDLCGTGGDGKNTFNISTLTSFIVAGAGYKVAKHGNYGVSSISGSSNVLEALGYQFTNNANELKKQMDKANICFMHAPLFHPALKSVGSIRKDLGVKTFFNMLGPLVNPAQPQYQMVGVFSLQLARLYQSILNKSHKSFTIIHGIDGYDEISLTGDVKITNKDGEHLRNPSYFYSDYILPDSIFGGNTIDEGTNIFKNILNNKGTDIQNKVVLANSAVAIHTINNKLTIEEAYNEAKTSLESGSAIEKLKILLK